jgi:micrococcal nuclease
VNYQLVAGDFARVYVFGGKPFQYAPAFSRAQAQAKTAKRGIWGPPCNGNTTKLEPPRR